MISRKLILPALAAVAVLALALLWQWYAPWPAMMEHTPVATPQPAPVEAGAVEPGNGQALVAPAQRRKAEQAVAALERRLVSAEERAGRLHETFTSADLEYRLSAARRLLEIAHAPHQALALLQQTLRAIEAAPGPETVRQALNDDIARLSEYTARSPRRAVPIIGELLAMLEPAPPDTADQDSGNWETLLVRLPDSLKAAVHVERRRTPAQEDTRLLRHLLLRARLAVLENDAQAFDVLTADAARLAGQGSIGHPELREALARLRSLDMQWHPPSIGAAFGPSPRGGE